MGFCMNFIEMCSALAWVLGFKGKLYWIRWDFRFHGCLSVTRFHFVLSCWTSIKSLSNLPIEIYNWKKFKLHLMNLISKNSSHMMNFTFWINFSCYYADNDVSVFGLTDLILSDIVSWCADAFNIKICFSFLLNMKTFMSANWKPIIKLTFHKAS